MMKKNIKLLNKKTEEPDIWTKPRTCKNCGHIDTGYYCSNCGQSFKELKRPFRYIIEDSFSLFNLDSSIFRTIGPFLFRPGFIASEYLTGKRRKYMSPVRLYLFLSIFFFFLAKIAAERSADSKTVINEMNEIPVSIITDGDTLKRGYTGTNLTENPSEVLIDSILAATGGESDKLSNSIQKLIKDEKGYYNELLNNLSYALFILMPVFALILFLLYVRRKRYYIEHLIFTLNMHSFALLILSVIVLLQLLIKGNDSFTFYLLLIIPVYFSIAMKRFYKQGVVKTLFKELVLAFAYGLFLVAALAGLALFTLFRM